MSLAVKAARAQVMGDPGFFGSIGKFLGGAAKIVGGILPGPVGGALKLAGGLLAPTRRQAPAPVAIAAQRRGSFFERGRAAGVRQAAPAPQLALAPGAPGAGLACPAGFKANKTDYHLKDGTFVPAGSRCVRVRRRNPLNVRAADRAIGRIESAKKAVTRLNRVTVRKACPHK